MGLKLEISTFLLETNELKMHIRTSTTRALNVGGKALPLFGQLFHANFGP